MGFGKLYIMCEMFKGYYHIHPKMGPMEGRQHTIEKHNILLPISGSNERLNMNEPKIKTYNSSINFNIETKDIAKFNILLKTLGFTYLNPHVYSDTVFFLGNFSKNFLINQKVLFGLGASIASFLFFFLIGYLSKFLSKYAQNQKIWKVINIFIITFMSFLTLYIFLELI